MKIEYLHRKFEPIMYQMYILKLRNTIPEVNSLYRIKRRLDMKKMRLVNLTESHYKVSKLKNTREWREDYRDEHKRNVK